MLSVSMMLPLLLAAVVAQAAPNPASPDPASIAAKPPETRQCMRNRDIRAQRIAADTGYFVRTWQGWWRNTGPACPSFGTNRMLVSVRPSDTQCSGDIVNVVDQFSRIDFGACSLGGWERVDDAKVPPPYQPGRP